ncbi:MAG: hypothetical protein ACRBEE_11720 [Arenicella sp.]
MLIAYRRFVILITSSLLFMSSIASAHPENSSIFQTLFGESLIHWLTAHQGFVFVATAVVLAIGWFFHRAIVKLQNANDAQMKVKH